MAVSRHFRYATVLRVRQRQEEARAIALAEVRRQIQFVERRRSALTEEQTRTLEAASEAARGQGGGFVPGIVEPYYQYERYLAKLVTEQDAALVSLRSLELQRKDELLDAMKRRRTIEMLEEHHHRDYRAYINKQEQKQSDEAAAIRAAVRRNNP